MKKGFTLLELIICLSILALLMAFALINFKGQQQKIACKSMANMIAFDLRLMQYNARAYNNTTSFKVSDKKRYSLFIGTKLFKNVSLTQYTTTQAEIDAPAVNSNIVFYPGHADKDNPGKWSMSLSNPQTMNIVVKCGNYQSVVSLLDNGEILVDEQYSYTPPSPPALAPIPEPYSASSFLGVKCNTNHGKFYINY